MSLITKETRTVYQSWKSLCRWFDSAPGHQVSKALVSDNGGFLRFERWNRNASGGTGCTPDLAYLQCMYEFSPVRMGCSQGHGQPEEARHFIRGSQVSLLWRASQADWWPRPFSRWRAIHIIGAQFFLTTGRGMSLLPECRRWYPHYLCKEGHALRD